MQRCPDNKVITVLQWLDENTQTQLSHYKRTHHPRQCAEDVGDQVHVTHGYTPCWDASASRAAACAYCFTRAWSAATVPQKAGRL